MGLSGSHLHVENVGDVSPFTTEILVTNHMQTPVPCVKGVVSWLEVLIVEAKHHGDASPSHGVLHSVPPGEHAIMSGYLKEPKATLFIRTGLHEAKKAASCRHIDQSLDLIIPQEFTSCEEPHKAS